MPKYIKKMPARTSLVYKSLDWN